MKKSIVYPLILTVLFLTISCTHKLVIVDSGKAESVIIIAENATDVEIKAAKVLRDYLYRISGAEIEILSDRLESAKNEILIGRVNRPGIKNIQFDELQKDGFSIKNTGKNLIIVGGNDKGVLYGVYTFLENCLGCRKYTSTVSYIPQKETIKLKPFDITEIPHFTYREVFYRDAYDAEYMDWHKLHCHGEVGPSKDWGFWCHSFAALIPINEYGETHPEYYSFYDGKRNPGSQLCLTNTNVFDITVANLKKAIDKNPGASLLVG